MFLDFDVSKSPLEVGSFLHQPLFVSCPVGKVPILGAYSPQKAKKALKSCFFEMLCLFLPRNKPSAVPNAPMTALTAMPDGEIGLTITKTAHDAKSNIISYDIRLLRDICPEYLSSPTIRSRRRRQDQRCGSHPASH